MSKIKCFKKIKFENELIELDVLKINEVLELKNR